MGGLIVGHGCGHEVVGPVAFDGSPRLGGKRPGVGGGFLQRFQGDQGIRG